MERLKFRAWDKKRKEMFLSPGEIEHLGSWFDSHLPGAIADAKNIDIMQSTGLHDKNGTEIYEGDIYKDCEGKRSTVVWKDNGFKGLYISHRTYEGEPYTENVYLELRHTNDKRWGIEVIGDIYNNPELLESGE